MIKLYCVYKHTAPNGKVYIGITCRNPIKRWSYGNGYKSNVLFYRAIQKYGWENIKHEILLDGLSAEEASEKEIELIAFYNSADPRYGYNISSGGLNSDMKHSKQSKAKIKCNHKGTSGYHFTDQQKQHIALSKKKRVLCVELNLIFPSMSEAADYFGGTYSNISACCHGRLETSCGYHWRVIE